MIDIVNIKVKAGNGGDGAVTFRREKFIPKGGPDGGDGGKGGSVYFIAKDNMATLMDFRSKAKYQAQNGTPGMKKKMSGPDGEDLYIKVPVGTLIYEIRGDSQTLIADMNAPEKTFLLAKGGMGGVGNFKFRSSTNQTPYQYVPGEQGEEKEIKLEVKVIADVGLVGAPNAGKSTLINRLTNANAKVANYPFTTLEPNLGVCRYKDGFTFVIADIPGLIEGASQGKGLGDEFLRHVERTRILVHIIDPLDGGEDLVANAWNQYKMLRNELSLYGKAIEDKKEIIVINKMDVTEIKEAFSDIEKVYKKKKLSVFGISASSGEGVEKLLDAIVGLLQKNPERPIFEATHPVKLYTIANLPNKRIVFSERNVLIKEHKGKFQK
jgi:GTP-binding protein